MRGVGFPAFCLVSLILFRGTVAGLAALAIHDERYTHILVVPAISACLFYFRRDAIFNEARFCASVGVPVLLIGLVLFFISGRRFAPSVEVDGLSVRVFAALLVWTAGFIIFYGLGSLRSALFPVCFLALMIPWPSALVDKAVILLQNGSAETASILFKLARVPVFRQGLKFSLPGVDIEVAEQCSGIRSSISLLISGILLSYLFLRSGWRRLALSLLTIPITIFKNAVRIVTISWLGVYVNPGFFHGRLHRQGGLPFSLLALAILATTLWVLHRSDRRRPVNKPLQGGAPPGMLVSRGTP